MLPSLTRTLVPVMALGLVAHGQVPFGNNITFAFSKKNLRADMVTTTTHQSPWGPMVLEERGTIQIRNDSRFRIDYESGHTYIVVPRYRTRLDAELRIATQTFVNTEEHTVSGRREWWDLKKAKTKEQVEGWKVTLYQSKGPLSLTGADSVPKSSEYVHEYWVSDDLDIPLITRRTWPGTEVVQRLTNIRLEDPGREAFAIPDGYRMLTNITGKASLCPAGIENTITGSGKVERSTFLAAGCK